MKKKHIVLFSIMFLLFFNCLEPDPQETEQQELIIRLGTAATDPEVLVLDIDPDEAVILSIWDPVTNTRLPGETLSNTSSITAGPLGANFRITGVSPGGMGIITFRSPSRGLSADLRVFIRNWKAADVHRNVLYADMTRFPFSNNVYNYDLSPNANGVFAPNTLAAYYNIRTSGFHYEAPDGLSSRSGRLVHGDTPRADYRDVHDVPHIIQVIDSNYFRNIGRLPGTFALKKEVFQFIMHFDLDGDMVGGFADRQRLELKTMDGASDNPNMFSRGGGDSFTHRWKFRLPDDFRVSTEYTHIHQIKPEGGDSGNPIFTLTARRLRTGREVMQLIYRGPIRANGDPSVNWYPCEVDLQPFKGEWIRAEQTIIYDNPGSFRFRLVRIRDMRILMEYIYSPEQYKERDPFMMFRPENTYIRPKFGIYRRIFHMTPFGLPDLNNPVIVFNHEKRNERGEREMIVLFADFEMDKLIR